MPIDIKQKRTERGLTLEELGNMVGVSKSTVKKWESGYIKNMKRDKILALSKALDVSPLELLNIPSNEILDKKNATLLSDSHKKNLEKLFNITLSEGTIIYLKDNRAFSFQLSTDLSEKIWDFISSCTPD